MRDRRSAAGPGSDRRRQPGGPVRHPLCDDHHRSRISAPVRTVRDRGAAVHAARHRLHRLDPREPRGLDHGDAGALLLLAHRPRATRARHFSCATSSAAIARCSPGRWRIASLVFAAGAGVAVAAAVYAATLLPRTFLPPFNEGTLTIGLQYNPGISLREIATGSDLIAERLLMAVPEVTSVGRRTGRAELDEHAEGVHYSEIDVDLKRSSRTRPRSRRHPLRGWRCCRLRSTSASRSRTGSITCSPASVPRSRSRSIGDDLDTLRRLAEIVALPAGIGAGHHRSPGREAESDSATAYRNRSRACRALRDNASRVHAGAGRHVERPDGVASGDRGKPPLRRSHPPFRLGPLDDRAGRSSHCDAFRSCPASQGRQHRRSGRPKPDFPGERPAPHRALCQQRRHP